MNVPMPVQRAVDVIENNGFEAYLVGGCVRDMLMNVPPHDYDITTNALPMQVKEMFNGYTVVETGLKHGTVTVVIDRENIEITTYRIDGEYADNRRPAKVAFASSIEDDLSRRDFTVNAMAYSPERGLVDLFSGQEDIEKGIIRCVGEPDKRFNEDGLRIMRALRFAATLGYEIAEETAVSIHKNKDLLKNISAERIYSEFSQLVCGINAGKVIRNYADVIAVFIPELLPMIGCEQNIKYHCFDVFEHSMVAFDNTPPTLEVRLAALFHDIAKPLCKTIDVKGIDHFKGHQPKGAQMVRDIFNRLKTDNYIKDYVCKLVAIHDEQLTSNKADIRRHLSRYGYDFVCNLLDLQIGDSIAHAKEHQEFAQISHEVKKAIDEVYAAEGVITLKELKINGSYLMEMGITDGKKIGEILNSLLEKVLNGEVENDLDKLKKLVL